MKTLFMPNFNASSENPRNSVRCFLTAATLACFARSNVTLLLCLSKAESSPLQTKLTRTLTTPDAAMLCFGF